MGEAQAATAYLSGFGNQHESEALPGALPVGRNSPQLPPYGLYAEQVSGTAFTAPRSCNRRSWLYRIRPALAHGHFECFAGAVGLSTSLAANVPPEALRWSVLPWPERSLDFVESLSTYACNGDARQQAGAAVHLYAATRSMQDRWFYDADGELLLVPQQGRLRIATELGVIEVAPWQVALLPRGLRFAVELPDGPARGYVCENFGAPFRLPDLGAIGANGLANARDFQAPVAAFEDRTVNGELIARSGGQLWRAPIDHSPLDVVAWHGNHVPYRYDLRRFNTMGSISFDHPDPSIFIVLQSPSMTPGVGDIDFVIFPPRWLVAEETFRPPWFHRNIASEFMGLVHGSYDAKASGFEPGGASLHNCFCGHGPDATSWERATAADTSTAQHLQDTLAFMFETRLPLQVTQTAWNAPHRQHDYADCWLSLASNFSGRP